LTLKSSNAPKGFTLLEVLITLIILSVALLALAGMMVTTTRNNASGGYVTEAATLAQDKLEEFRVSSWERLLPTTSGPQTDPSIKGSTGLSYARSWNIAQDNNIKTITIAVSWTDRINHSIRLVSVIAQ
jgi:prepilin-type N-terminal cleavage/methylation domain-containing protein